VARHRVPHHRPRTVIEPAEQALRSSGAFIGLLRKVQGLNSNLFRG